MRDSSAQLACVLCRKALFSLPGSARGPVRLDQRHATGLSHEPKQTKDAVVRGPSLGLR